MNHIRIIIPLLLLLTYTTANAETVLKATTSWDGGQIYYPEGQAELTLTKILIEENKPLKFHCHPVPTFGYVAKGNLEVETKSGKKILLTEGNPAVEVMRTLHRGKAIGGDVEVMVFYAGSTTIPNTVLEEDEASSEHCQL